MGYSWLRHLLTIGLVRPLFGAQNTSRLAARMQGFSNRAAEAASLRTKQPGYHSSRIPRGLPRGDEWSVLFLITVGCLVINGGMWLIALQFFPRQSPTAILHYSIDAGVDFVGEGQHITVLPLLGSALLILNLIIGFAVVKADRAAAWVLWSSMPLVQLCLSVGLIFLWSIN